MKKKLTIIAVLLQFLTAGLLKAQIDPHFSQYYANPLWLNPALTGVINGDARVTANYKNQWANINNAYNTGALAADFRATDKIGVGINILDQSAAGSSFNYFTAYGSFSYSIAIAGNGQDRLSFGLQAGLISRSFNMNSLQFGNQYNPLSGYDPSISSSENFSNTKTSVFDSSVGAFYYDGSTDKTVNVFGGVSIAHLNRPRDPFSDVADSKVPLRYTVHGGVRIKTSDYFDLMPNAIYIQQQKASIKAVGLYSEIKFPNEQGLILGALYRVDDAAMANVGYHLNNLIIGASYDFNT